MEEELTEEFTLGEKLNVEFKFAIAVQKATIDAAAVLATEIGVGIYVTGEWSLDGIVVVAAPDERVPVGEVWAIDYTKYNKTRDIEGSEEDAPQ